MNSYKLTPPPPTSFESGSYEPDIKSFLIELRTKILNISIDKFVSYMNWSNEKYYQQIVNGYKTKEGIRKYKHPTINYLFSSLNYAMNNHDVFIKHKNDINKLIFKYIVKW